MNLRRTAFRVCAGITSLLCFATTRAQAPGAQTATALAGNAVVSTPQSPPASPGGTFKLTLADALERAKTMSPAFERAAANVKIARTDTVQARAANLPTVSFTTQYLYTQGNGTPIARFIANNGVHEYISQGNAHEVLSGALVAQYRRSIVAQALARDELAITQRGLVVTVVQSYATLVASDNKYKALQLTTEAAQDFLKTTQQLETGGEVAHADVVKARIQFSDAEVALEDAQLVREQARVALALLLFQDVNQSFEAVDDPGQTLPLPAFSQVQAEALQHNPALEAAFDTEKAASSDITAARFGYLPTLTFDYFYGIDANEFSTRTRGIENLGYSALAALNLPIWNWGATHSQVKAAQYRKQQAVTDRMYAQRKLVADLQQFYTEAKVTKSEMEIRQTAARDAEESARLTTLQYKAGDATALEVVNAQNTFSLEHNALEDAKARYATALANLATLTGTL